MNEKKLNRAVFLFPILYVEKFDVQLTLSLF